ncbi:MAG: methyltransferase domain-containing protein [Verrucomicrobiae bacterium]|nr:methyltransferase domain-containing protein [Verrucomicrobiae bacterium]
MRLEHQPLLVCPACRGPLALGTGPQLASDHVMEGALDCRACPASYPIRGGVPRFVPEANYAAGFGLQWNRHAATQLDSFTGLPLTENRFFSDTRWPRQLDGQTLLEAGCGAGRFTEIVVRTGALLVSLDYSAAVDANFSSNGHHPNLLIVQGDIYAMPFACASFDRVFCLGVLQHTPDVHRSFQQLPRFLKPGGHLAVDVYRRFPWWKQWTITKYWARPITRRIPPERLYPLVERYVRTLWPLTRGLHRLPYGRNLNWKLLIADYQGMYPLSPNLLEDWAVLDTFDMLAPAYDDPQTPETIRSWFLEAGLQDVELADGSNGVVGRGRKPAGPGPTAS